MLSPNARQIYLEQLRPPGGYTLDRAIATTFSLDLLSLLMAPLSMALNDCRNREEVLGDPIAVLEGLRQTSDRFAVFCQRGRIAVPRSDTRLYSYLEKIVVEVQAPRDAGVFHPKAWLLRFVSDEEEPAVFYRFLCLSRNLTFDRSWDTVLTLEGPLVKRRLGFGRNRPLADFFATLPRLAATAAPPPIRELVGTLAEEVARVGFEPPEGFHNEIRFIPVGIPGHRKAPRLDRHRRLLIMSPFLSEDSLVPLTVNGDDNVLISRPESLDALGDDTIESVEEFTRVFFMDQAAERPGDFDDAELSDPSGRSAVGSAPQGTNDRASAANSSGRRHPSGSHDTAGRHGLSGPYDLPDPHDPSGLHAKLFISEEGWDARILTGSANATQAALNGRNVELLVELIGPRSKVGIDAFLGEENERLSFRSMLRPYSRGDAQDEPDPIRQALETDLERARRALSKLRLIMSISEDSDDAQDSHTAALLAKTKASRFPRDVTGRCRPISLQAADAVDISPLLRGRTVTFPSLSLVALTSFVAFELTAERKGQKGSVSFVLNVPVSGMPADRDKRVLLEIVSDSGRFIRYLLFILTGEEGGLGAGGKTGSGFDGGSQEGPTWLTSPTLLEELVRAYSRQPEKIDRIARLVEDLQSAGQAQDILPEGFEEIWRVFLAARGKGKPA